MPYKCSVFGCNGNYDKGDKVSIFRFAKDNQLKTKWIQRVMRKDFRPLSSSRICEKHFQKEDILYELDFFNEKAGKHLKCPLAYSRIKDGAVPVFLTSNCPSYLQPTAGSSRDSPESKRKRLEHSSMQKALDDSRKLEQECENSVRFSSIQELFLCLQRKTIDEFWTLYLKGDNILIMHISIEIPEIICCVVINKDLNINLTYKRVPLQKLGKFNFPLKISNINILFDILSSLKNFVKPENSLDGIKNSYDVLINLFQELKSNSNLPKSHIKFVDFVTDQLIKINVAKNQRRHSADLLVFCSLLKSISPHCYKFFRNSEFFILSHPGTLTRICSEFNINPGDEQNDENFLAYIKQKFVSLNEKEKSIPLMIDEIHLKSNFDYVGEKLTGMAFNGSEAASSAHVFMVQSLLSSYKDVAHILPVSSITAEKFYSWMKKIITGLENIGFNVISVITDNNSINRKAMSLFSTPPKLNIQYKNPCAERHMYFLIDSVHILKCIRNNWLNKKNNGKCMFYPNFNTLLPFNTASFEALKKLHEMESGKLLKHGYGLTLKALYPSSLERQNVKLALQILNNVTAEGLLALGKENNIEHYEGTAEYIKIITKWWSIMNVKTLFKGEHKRDSYQEPLTPNSNEQYDFLNKFIEWLNKWEDMKCNTGGLSKPTHLALKHTTTAIIDMAKYCFKNLGFSVFLPGKIQTDSLEERFGSYRQLAGSQYFISIRQVYETESKLRLQSILPFLLNSKCYGEFSLSFFDKQDWKGMENSASINYFVNTIEITPEDIVDAQSDISILTYVSGYAVHTVEKKLKCEQCKFSLVCDQSLNIDINNDWISKLDRHGLKYPHSDVVCVTVFNYAVVKKLLSANSEEKFLLCQNQRCVVCNITLDVLQENNIFLGLDECDCDHDYDSIIKQIVWVTTNIFLNNYCKRQNDMLYERKITPNERNKKALALKKVIRKFETLKK